MSDAELREDYIIPSVFNRDVAAAVAEAVAAEAKATGAATAGDEVGSPIRTRIGFGRSPRREASARRSVLRLSSLEQLRAGAGSPGGRQAEQVGEPEAVGGEAGERGVDRVDAVVVDARLPRR